MRRRQGTRKGDIPGGFSSDEQRSRRLTFGETRRAEVLLDLGRVAPPSQIAADMLRRRTEQQINLAASRACVLPKSKTPFSGALHNFWKGSEISTESSIGCCSCKREYSLHTPSIARERPGWYPVAGNKPQGGKAVQFRAGLPSSLVYVGQCGGLVPL